MHDQSPPTRGKRPRRKSITPVSIKPVKKKVGEEDKNLRRREEWYQRRAGDRRSRPLPDP
jgi:hypothetical protein